MATIHALLGFLCLAAFGQPDQPAGDLLRAETARTYSRQSQVLLKKDQSLTRVQHQILYIAGAEIGVRERSGQNDGQRVETYLRYVHLKKGNPWCAAYVSWVYGAAGFALPRTGWSPALFPNNLMYKGSSAIWTDESLPGAIFGIYSTGLKRIVHCGIIEQKRGNWFHTIEGNTNLAGSPEGDGVYRKRRLMRTIHSIALWYRLKKKGGGNEKD